MPAEKRLGLDLKVLSELLRDVGQRAELIRFPEPAAAAVLELIDEVLRLVRLRFNREPLATGRMKLLGARDAVDDQEEDRIVDSRR